MGLLQSRADFWNEIGNCNESLQRQNRCCGLVFSTVELNGKRKEPDGAMTAKKVWLQMAIPKKVEAIVD